MIPQSKISHGVARSLAICSWLAVLNLTVAGCGQAGKLSGKTAAFDAPFLMPPIVIPVFPTQEFVITDFGATPGGTVDNTAAIDRAVTACHAAGGGHVVVPAGQWSTGPIHFQSNVDLHLAKDAVLNFSDDPNAYLPAVQSSWEGLECFNYSPLVYAFNCDNVALTGAGILKPRMTTWTKWFARPPAHLAALKALYTMAATGVPVEQRQMARGENHLRPQLIQFNRCRHVLIEGITIRGSPFWTLHLLLCDNVAIRRVDIAAHGHNNDGIDPEMSRNVLIDSCRFDQGDDDIAIKSGTDRDGWRLNTPTENIVIRNCTAVAGHELVAIGSELSGGVRNVYVHDCRFEGNSPPAHLLYIKTNRRRGGFVESVTLENIHAVATTFGVLGIETDVLYEWRTLVPTYEERLTSIRGIHLRNVTVQQTATPFLILGDPRRPVGDVSIDQVTIGTVHGQRQRYENAPSVQEQDVHIGTFIAGPDKANLNR